VNFRMGNLDQAEKFLRAAWSLTQNSLIADHRKRSVPTVFTDCE
jgi:hypothetical protein